MTELSYKVEAEQSGSRLDAFLSGKTAHSRSLITRLIREETVKVNGQPAKASYKVSAGDNVTLSEPSQPARKHYSVSVPVVYEDDDLLIVDKPAGLLVHPASLPEPSLVDFIRSRTSDTDPERPGIVHRLDKDTSGLVALAKTAEAKTALQSQFKNRQAHKIYLALVKGRLEPEAAEIKLPIGRAKSLPTRRDVHPEGKPAVTRYRTLAAYPGYSLLEIELETGRTHQIRVHMAHLGHPVAGDRTYGSSDGLSRQFLHAARLSLTGPHGQKIDAESPLPPELADYLSNLTKL